MMVQFGALQIVYLVILVLSLITRKLLFGKLKLFNLEALKPPLLVVVFKYLYFPLKIPIFPFFSFFFPSNLCISPKNSYSRPSPPPPPLFLFFYLFSFFPFLLFLFLFFSL